MGNGLSSEYNSNERSLTPQNDKGGERSDNASTIPVFLFSFLFLFALFALFSSLPPIYIVVTTQIRRHISEALLPLSPTTVRAFNIILTGLQSFLPSCRLASDYLDCCADCDYYCCSRHVRHTINLRCSTLACYLLREPIVNRT